MKRQWIKNIALFLMLGTAMTLTAQQPQEPNERKRREIPSPENNAKRIVKEFKNVFQLTDEGYEQVYELYLKQEKALLPSEGNRGGMPGRGGMGGPRGGMGGPGFGGPGNGGMGGPGGRFDEMNGNVPEDMQKMMQERMKEQEKKRESAAKKLSKKMKKILKGEKYNRWQEWENERMKKSMPPQGPGPRFERDTQQK